jgi:hypothetical protein
MVLQYFAAALFLLFVIIFFALFIQYRKHKKPLMAIDPNVQYSFAHHIKMVTLPTLTYRLHDILPKKKRAAISKPTITPDSPSGDTADQR